MRASATRRDRRATRRARARARVALQRRRRRPRRPRRRGAPRARSTALAAALGAHDPERVVARGYAVVDDRDGDVITSAADGPRAPATVRLFFADADVDATIEDDDRAATDADDPELTYEAATARLEAIIRRLDSGEAGLRETLELVREGRGLVEFCAGELDAVGQGLEELRLDELVARLESGPHEPVRGAHRRPAAA